MGKGFSLKRLIAKFSTVFDQIAFWRKSGIPLSDEPAVANAQIDQERPVAAPEINTPTPDPAPKIGWFVRLLQALPWRRQSATEEPLDPDQCVIIERPSREQLEASEEIEDKPKRSLLARLSNRFRRQSNQQLPENSNDQTETDEQDADIPVDENDAPQSSWFKRLLAKLRNKWIWIPIVSSLFLALIGIIIVFALHSAQEKERLEKEVHQMQRQLEKQTTLAKPTAIAPQNQTMDMAPANTSQALATSKSSPQTTTDSGDCLITNKESVASSLKDCIDQFNNTSKPNRKP